MRADCKVCKCLRIRGTRASDPLNPPNFLTATSPVLPSCVPSATLPLRSGEGIDIFGVLLNYDYLRSIDVRGLKSMLLRPLISNCKWRTESYANFPGLKRKDLAPRSHAVGDPHDIDPEPSSYLIPQDPHQKANEVTLL